MKPRAEIVTRGCFDAMYRAALEMVGAIGIETDRREILDRIAGKPGFTLHGNRIRVAADRIEELLQALRTGSAAATEQTEPAILVPQRAFLIADHRSRELRTLTRRDVIDGTKLICALKDRNVKPGTCGVPQECSLELRPFEQYLIGVRYSPGGGSTDIPCSPTLRSFMLRIREIAEPGFSAKRLGFFAWCPSPLKLMGTELDEMIDADADTTVTSYGVGSMPIMGLTGPVDPIGIHTLGIAEALGGTAILRALYPQARSGIRIHPQPMDPGSGLMAFGTPEWNKLDLIENEVYEHLGLRHRHKECLTSAAMPDNRAQSDKMSSIAWGVAAGCTSFQVFPLCNDEAWSPVQCLLDVEYVHDAWTIGRRLDDTARAAIAVETVRTSVETGEIVGGSMDTVMHLRDNYLFSRPQRHYSAGQWQDSGFPDGLRELEGYAQELTAKAEYHPPVDMWNEVMDVYRQVCRQTGDTPADFG